MNVRGVSTAVGVILVVFITILLASIIIISVTEIGLTEQSPLVATNPEISVEEYDGESVQVFSVRNLNGDSVKKENLQVRLSGSGAKIEDAVFVDNGVFDDGTWDPGETLIVKISTEGLCLEEGDDFQYTLVHEPSSTAFAVQDIKVKKEFEFEIIEKEQIKSNQQYSAKIELLGTELSSVDHDDNRIVHNPITTKIMIGSESVRPWPSSSDGDDDLSIKDDVNDPTGPETFNYNTQKISPDRKLSVTSTAWTGDYYNGIDEYITVDGDSYERYQPTELGEKRMTVSTESHNSNLVLLTDGEKVPDPSSSGIDQKSAEEILGGKIKNGRLKLNDNQVVAFVELSEEDASLDDASNSGDPDYNDVIFLITLKGEDDISKVMASEDGDPTTVVCTQDG